MGFVFQSFNLVLTLTVAGKITLPLDLAGGDGDPEWISALIDLVGLRDRLHLRPCEPSGGQQQRVAVARAFAGQPDVAVARAFAGQPDIVFAGEPAGNLGSRSGGRFSACSAAR